MFGDEVVELFGVHVVNGKQLRIRVERMVLQCSGSAGKKFDIVAGSTTINDGAWSCTRAVGASVSGWPARPCLSRVGVGWAMNRVVVIWHQKVDKVFVTTTLAEYSAAIRQAYVCAPRAQLDGTALA